MTRKLIFYSCMLILFLPSCSRTEVDHGSFNIGVNQSIKSAPVVLATQLGLYKKEGLTVDIEIESSAVDLMEALFSKKYDLICIPENQAVIHAFSNDQFRIIAVLNRNQSRYLVMDDRSLQEPSELTGMHIGLGANSAAGYTLYRILLFNGIPSENVTTQQYAPIDLPQALARREVDAIIAWEPFTSIAMKLLGEHGRAVNAHLGRDMYWLLVTRLDIAQSRSEDLSALLVALNKAISRLNEDTNRALAMCSTALSLSDNAVDTEWNDYTFYLELPQSLLLAMEQEGAWYQKQNTTGGSFPQFFDLIDSRALSRVLDKRVTMFGIGASNSP